jgi:hypothetical protein
VTDGPRPWAEGKPAIWSELFPDGPPPGLTWFTAPWTGRYLFTSDGVFALDPPPHDPQDPDR